MASISGSIPTPLQTGAQGLTTVALQVASTDAAGTDGAIELTLAQPPDIKKTTVYRQWQAQAAVGADTEALANTVTSAFKDILALRPDLADAQFDFVSGNGVLKVISSDLSDDDRRWLEQQLNANTSLLGAVGVLNADMSTAIDARNAVQNETDGSSTAPAAKVPDGSIHYLAFLQSLAHAAGQTGALRDASYTDGEGKPFDLSKVSTTSLSGMIDARRQMDALQQGTIIAILGNGKTLYGARRDPGIYLPAAGMLAGDASTDPSASQLLRASGQKGIIVNKLV